jgi:hypothetical protein
MASGSKVRVRNVLDRLEFDDDFVRHKEIEAVHPHFPPW